MRAVPILASHFVASLAAYPNEGSIVVSATALQPNFVQLTAPARLQVRFEGHHSLTQGSNCQQQGLLDVEGTDEIQQLVIGPGRYSVFSRVGNDCQKGLAGIIQVEPALPQSTPWNRPPASAPQQPPAQSPGQAAAPDLYTGNETSAPSRPKKPLQAAIPSMIRPPNLLRFWHNTSNAEGYLANDSSTLGSSNLGSNINWQTLKLGDALQLPVLASTLTAARAKRQQLRFSGLQDWEKNLKGFVGL